MRAWPFLVAATLAALVAQPGQAAEPGPRPAAAAVERLRACPGGGFVLPGSSACLRLTGSVATEMTLRSGSSAATGRGSPTRLLTSRVEGRIAADMRVPTEAGPLRAYVSIRGRTARFPDAARP